MKMEKIHTNRYPQKGKKPLDLYQGLTSMLNCSEYLGSNGFEISSYGQTLGGIFVFSNGLEVNNSDFNKIFRAGEMDHLLKRVIKERMAFKRRIIDPESGCFYGNNILKVRFATSSRNYHARLSLKKNRKGLFLFSDGFYLNYSLELEGLLINDSDLLQFEGHKQGLDEAMRHEGILTFPSKGSAGKSKTSSPKSSDPISELNPNQISQYRNPFEIEMPNDKRIESLVYGDER